MSVGAVSGGFFGFFLPVSVGWKMFQNFGFLTPPCLVGWEGHNYVFGSYTAVTVGCGRL